MQMMMTMAPMPEGAAGNASVAMGFILAPLMLRRGPMGAQAQAQSARPGAGRGSACAAAALTRMRAPAGMQLGAPQMPANAAAPAVLASLPANVQRQLGFATAAENGAHMRVAHARCACAHAAQRCCRG
jgi:hypothetical protein